MKKLSRLKNKKPQNKYVKQLKTNHHIPNISSIFSTKGNKQDWWLPLLSNTKTAIQKDTSRLALIWANIETPKQFWI